jgi:hypothetical protein
MIGARPKTRSASISAKIIDGNAHTLIDVLFRTASNRKFLTLRGFLESCGYA